jgi:hypothetical protein
MLKRYVKGLALVGNAAFLREDNFQDVSLTKTPPGLAIGRRSEPARKSG